MATKKKQEPTGRDPYPSPEPPPEEVLPPEDPEVMAAEQDPSRKTWALRGDGLNITMSPKQALLLYLWSYSGSPGIPKEQREDILNTRKVLDQATTRIRFLEIDPERMTWRPDIGIRKGYSEKLIEEHLTKPWTLLAVAEMFGLKERFLELNKRPEAPAFIKQGKHLTKNFLGPEKGQLKMSFAEKLEQYTQETGLTMNNRPEGFGLDLNVVQQETLHAILGAFSKEEYQGHITLPKEDALTDPKLEAGSYQVGKVRAAGSQALYRRAWANIAQVPEIRLSLADIVRLAGYDHERQGDKQKVKEAVEHLSRTLYAFYWKRKAWKIAKGQIVGPDLGKDGEQKLEEVMEYGPILRVKQITDDQTKQLKYFEISPSAVVLDQVNPTYGGNYFLMVPGDLHAKVKKAVGGGKRSSSYTYVFLLYLMDYYERLRHNSGHKDGVTIRKPWEELAQRLRMPETVWKRNKVKALERLETIYQVAKELGYLKSYRMGKDGVVTLELEPQAYYHPKKELQEAGTEGEKG